MLINFSVSNFLSMNETQVLSMKAGKARKHEARLYRDPYNKLTKSQAIFGANASGKSNLVEAIRFMQYMVLEGFPRGFSEQYFRQTSDNQFLPSSFEVEFLLNKQRFVYGFSSVLKNGILKEEHLYEITKSNITKEIFTRDLDNEQFHIGPYFRNKSDIEKLDMYGQDSSSDSQLLFLSVMNQGKAKMYAGNQRLAVLQRIYLWFRDTLIISNPDTPLTGTPYFSETNLPKLAKLLHALGTGTSNVKMVEVTAEKAKSKVPEEFFNKVTAALEQATINKETESPAIMLRSHKEFFVFELNDDGTLVIKTIEFSHENKNVFFNLSDESDGTARLLDLIDILFDPSDNRVFVIDEIDRCLHPALTERIVSLFLEMAINREAQLIITTHEARLLKKDLFRNDEICFVIKNNEGESILNPLEQFHLRADKKVYDALFDGSLPNVLPDYDTNQIQKLLDTK